MKNISEYVRILSAKVKKGEIRNTILRQIKLLERAISQISQGRDIKQKEIKEYQNKNPEKTEKLRRQVDIMNRGIQSLNKALDVLKDYKNVTPTGKS